MRAAGVTPRHPPSSCAPRNKPATPLQELIFCRGCACRPLTRWRLLHKHSAGECGQNMQRNPGDHV